MNTFYYTTFDSPFGKFSAAVDQDGRVVAAAFGDIAALRKRPRLSPSATGQFTEDGDRTKEVRRQVDEYFAGRRREFDLDLAPAGTAFQQRVWRELQRIPFGETRSYGTLAQKLASGPRAVGLANGANPICVIVPCHRVIGADGSLTGFAFGVTIKRDLLAHEAARVHETQMLAAV